MNDFLNEEWFNRFKSYVSCRKPLLNSYNLNSYNYKYDMLGREATVEAYRSVIFYIQLSPNIDINRVEVMIKEVYKHLYNSASRSYGKYHIMFMNDNEGNLMHNGKPFSNWNDAIQAVIEFENKYSLSNYQYSKCLKMIFPFTGIYTRETYPSKKDLCILITDCDGITIDDDIKSRLISSCNKLISVEADIRKEGKTEWITRV